LYLGFKESMQHPSLRRLLHAITEPEQTAAVLDSNQSWPGFLRSGGGSRRPEADAQGRTVRPWTPNTKQGRLGLDPLRSLSELGAGLIWLTRS
jgi:hypothetical protein